jgi:hypothetical protein
MLPSELAATCGPSVSREMFRWRWPPPWPAQMPFTGAEPRGFVIQRERRRVIDSLRAGLDIALAPTK